jgi:hypothetical protein
MYQLYQVLAEPEQLRCQTETFRYNLQPKVQDHNQTMPGNSKAAAPRLPSRLDLWKGMHICIVGTLGKLDPKGSKFSIPLKGYDGYIKAVNEYSEDKAYLDVNQTRPQEAHPRHEMGHHCPSGCPTCLPESLTVDVQISAQEGRLQKNVDIMHIRPAE